MPVLGSVDGIHRPVRSLIGTGFGFVLLAVAALALAGCGDDRSAAREESVQSIRGALETDHDPAKAVALAVSAVRDDADSSVLQYWLGRSYQARGRQGDALKAFERAAEIGNEELRDAIQFGIAKSCALRFIETRDREDLNRCEGDLRGFASGGAHAASASILLGIALSEPTPRRDPKRALELLEQGFRLEAQPSEIDDVARARTRLEELRKELGH